MKRKPFTIFIFILMSYSALYLGRKNYALCMPAIINEGLLTNVQVGFIGTVFLICYATGQTVNGFLGDHVMPNRMITIGLTGSGIANMLMGIVSPEYLSLAWGLNGVFCSMCWAPSIRFLGMTQPEEKVTKRAAGMVFATTIGTVVCYAVSGLILSIGGSWRVTFIICGATIILIALCDLFYFRTSQMDLIDTAKTVSRDDSGVSQSISISDFKHLRMMAFFQTGLLGLAISVLFNGVLKDGLDLWVQTIMSEFFGIDISTTVVLSFALPLINIFGVLLARYLVDEVFHDEIKTCMVLYGICSLFMGVFTIIAFTFTPSWRILAVSLSVFAVACTLSLVHGINNIVLTLIPIHYIRLNMTSTITGVFDSLSYLAAAISGVLAGYLSAKWGWFIVILYFLISTICGFITTMLNIPSYRRGYGRLREILTNLG